jgi:catechol 2,3-dioxygenase-like lactoylglutathione lyase family enzyme
MIDHVFLRARDFRAAAAFYKAALAPIGYMPIMEFPDAIGFGEKGKPDFWLTRAEGQPAATHVAFRADRPRIEAFFAAALAAGGSDNGRPGVRADYHPFYYAAFVLDPEGNNVEVVCHDSPVVRRARKRRGQPAGERPTPIARKKAMTRTPSQASTKHSEPRSKPRSKPRR